MGRSEIKRQQDHIRRCSKLLRYVVIEAYGGLSVLGKHLGVSRQLIDLWRQKGVPLERCSTVAHDVYGDYRMRWLLNFESVYNYEKWRGKAGVSDYWSLIVNVAPISETEKAFLMRKFNEFARKNKQSGI